MKGNKAMYDKAHLYSSNIYLDKLETWEQVNTNSTAITNLFNNGF